MKCPRCDRDNRDVALFCQYCGAALSPGRSSERTPHPEAGESEGSPDTLPSGVGEPTIQAPEHLWGESAPQGTGAPTEAANETEGAPAGPAPEESAFQAALATAAPREGSGGTSPQDLSEPETAAPMTDESIDDVGSGELADSAEGQPGRDEELALVGTPGVPPGPTRSQWSEEASGSEHEVTQAQATEPADAVLAGSPTGAAPDTEARGPEDQRETGFASAATPQEASVDPQPGYADEAAGASAPGAFPPLEPGTVVGGRYRIVETLSEGDRQTLYQVRDLQRCSRCGFADNSPDEAFCASCGAAMDQKPVATMLERPTSAEHEPVDTQVEDHFAEGERSYWVWRELEAPNSTDVVAQPLALTVGQRSDTGLVRELDEDSLFVLLLAQTYTSLTEQVALFVVADGMGGHEGGEVASRIAIQTMTEVLLDNLFAPQIKGRPPPSETILDWMKQAMHAANDRVYLERQKRESDMGTTVTAALIKGRTLYLAHVGDCRAYHWGEQGLRQLTTDHSIVASMIAAGNADPEEIYTHPQRSVIYRCIGDLPAVEVDTGVHPLSPGDRLVLCCDGLWEMIRSEGIEEVMLRESDPQKACDIMVEQSNLAGGTDNISVIVVQL